MSNSIVNYAQNVIFLKNSANRRNSRAAHVNYKEQLYNATNNLAGNQILLKPSSVARLLAVVTFLFVFASSASLLVDYLTGYNSVLVHKLVKFFYLDLEMNAPTFFSMLLMLGASLILAVITFLKRRQANSYIWQWGALSAGFLYMAFDEIIALHERLIEPMRAVMGEQNLGVFYFAWVVPAIGLILFLTVFFMKFLFNLPAKPRIRFIISGAIFLCGAIGFELLEGKYCETNSKDTLIYILMTTVEETMELGGVVIFIWALLEYIKDTFGAIRFQIIDSDADSK